jgi:hypothetical protein
MRDEFDPDMMALEVEDHQVLDPQPGRDETEPAMMIAVKISGFLLAVGGLAVAFGIVPPLTPDQEAAIAKNLIPVIIGIITIWGVVQSLIQGKLTRDRVVSPATAARLAVANTDNGYAQGLKSADKPQPILPIY